MAPNPVSELAPALVQTFVVVLVGYLSGKYSQLPDNASVAIDHFVTRVTLPALFFLGIARLDFSTVQWSFFITILTAKGLIYLAVALLTWIFEAGTGTGNVPMLIGIRGLFCTLQNDFAFGLPIFQAVYGKTNPAIIDYLYLVAPISIVILNPVSIGLLEYGVSLKQTEKAREQLYSPSNSDSEDSTNQVSESLENDGLHLFSHNTVLRPIAALCRKPRKVNLVLDVLKKLAATPVVFVVPFALAVNFIFNAKVPALISAPVEVLSQGYASAALFAVGLSIAKQSAMNREREEPIRESDVICALLLVSTKTLVLPILSLIFAMAFSRTEDRGQLAVAAFIYSTFPTAPSVSIFASNYGMSTRMLAPSVLLCTAFAAPIAFLSVYLVSLAMDSINLTQFLQIVIASADVGIVSGIASMVTAIAILYNNSRRRMTCLTALIFLYALLTALPAIGNTYEALTKGHDHRTVAHPRYLGRLICLIGASAGNKACVAAIAVRLMAGGGAADGPALRAALLLAAVAIPALVVVLLYLFGHVMREGHNWEVYSYGQALASLVINVPSVLLVSAGIAVISRRKARRGALLVPALSSDSSDTPDEEPACFPIRKSASFSFSQEDFFSLSRVSMDSARSLSARSSMEEPRLEEGGGLLRSVSCPGLAVPPPRLPGGQDPATGISPHTHTSIDVWVIGEAVRGGIAEEAGREDDAEQRSGDEDGDVGAGGLQTPLLARHPQGRGAARGAAGASRSEVDQEERMLPLMWFHAGSLVLGIATSAVLYVNQVPRDKWFMGLLLLDQYWSSSLGGFLFLVYGLAQTRRALVSVIRRRAASGQRRQRGVADLDGGPPTSVRSDQAP